MIISNPAIPDDVLSDKVTIYTDNYTVLSGIGHGVLVNTS